MRKAKEGLRRLAPQAHSAQIIFSRTTSLVRGGRAFYNPSNTALEAVACYPDNPGTQPQKNGCYSCERVLEY
jgi:hypothetical protein